MSYIEGTLRDRILNKKCKKHPTMVCDMLNVDSEAEQNRVCIICMEEKKIPIEQIMSISSLLNLDSSSVFPLYPLDETFLQLFKYNFNLEAVSKEIDNYFSELQKKIQEAINRVMMNEKKQIQELISSLEDNQSELKQYIFPISEVQELLLSQDINCDSKLREFISAHSSPHSRKKCHTIRNNYAYIDYVLSQYNLNTPLNNQKQILGLINKISLFGGSNKSLIFSSLIKQQKWDINTTDLIPSVNYYNSSKEFNIQKENNTIIIASKASSNKQCYLNQQLDPTKKYIIRLSLNNIDDYYPLLSFGLIKQAHKDSKQMSQSTGIYYDEETGDSTISLLKGSKLHSEQYKMKVGKKDYELRIDIQNRIWRVGSLPDYANVAQIPDQNQISPQEQYYLAFSIYNPQDYITINEIVDVPFYDNKM